MAVDTLGYLLALKVTPANEDDRTQVEALSAQLQEATAENVEIAYVDQGYTGSNAAEQAQKHGIELVVVKLEEAKRGFVLLPLTPETFTFFLRLSQFSPGLTPHLIGVLPPLIHEIRCLLRIRVAAHLAQHLRMGQM